MVNKSGQFQIMQMMIMIIGVILFFVLVALFIINIKYKDIADEAVELKRKEVIGMIETLANSPEFSCSSTENWCIDEDKVNIMSSNFSQNYIDAWALASIEIYKVYPNEANSTIECPGEKCNHFTIYDSGYKNVQTYSAYVTMCSRISRSRTDCSLVKFVLGLKND